MITATTHMEKELHNFWIKVKKGRGCWTWTASKANGYGKFYSKKWLGKKKLYYAHRFAYETTLGVRLKESELICHRCDNKACVNPAHLFAGSQLDNMRDCKSKGRTATGERHGMSKIEEANARAILSLAKLGFPQKKIAEMFGVSRSHVAGIKNGSKWARLQETS